MQLLALILTASFTCVLAGISCTDGDLTTYEGQPFIIDFGFRGIALFPPSYTKDGSVFIPNLLRTFIRRGKISFARTVMSDAGTYRFNAITFPARNFRRTICLTGN